jgi:hypothetical protein
MRNPLGKKAPVMVKPDILIVDGHAFSWRRLIELRHRQLGAWKAAEARQLALFELKDDSRPEAERTATGLNREPILLGLMAPNDDERRWQHASHVDTRRHR